jgi:hypothetical protein
MLCVCVWRGPIPVLHSHSLAIADLGVNESLAEHAVRFHADHLGEPELGFHFHFLMLTPCEGSLIASFLEHSDDVVHEAPLWCEELVKDLMVEGLGTDELAKLDGLVRQSPDKAQPPGRPESTFAISLLSQSSLISSYGVALI